MKVSFDFDGTLVIDVVGDYAKELVKRGVDVWVTTSRMDNFQGNPNWNDDLFDRIFKCKIDFTKVNFTNIERKAQYFVRTKSDFIWHLDDDWQEIAEIKESSTTIKAITNFGNPNWKNECEALLNGT